jgi:hypothetical protein
MARKAISEAVENKIATRLAFLNAAAESGNKTAETKAEMIVWTLNACNYSEDVVSGIISRATELASDLVDAAD